MSSGRPLARTLAMTPEAVRKRAERASRRTAEPKAPFAKGEPVPGLTTSDLVVLVRRALDMGEANADALRTITDVIRTLSDVRTDTRTSGLSSLSLISDHENQREEREISTGNAREATDVRTDADGQIGRPDTSWTSGRTRTDNGQEDDDGDDEDEARPAEGVDGRRDQDGALGDRVRPEAGVPPGRPPLAGDPGCLPPTLSGVVEYVSLDDPLTEDHRANAVMCGVPPGEVEDAWAKFAATRNGIALPNGVHAAWRAYCVAWKRNHARQVSQDQARAAAAEARAKSFRDARADEHYTPPPVSREPEIVLAEHDCRRLGLPWPQTARSAR